MTSPRSSASWLRAMLPLLSSNRCRAKGANRQRQIFSRARRISAANTAHFSLATKSSAVSEERQDVRVPALEPRTGHHHPGKDFEWWLRALRRDRDPARHLPKNLQPNGPVRSSLDYFRPQQSRHGLRPGCARSNRSGKSGRTRRAKWAHN